MPRVQAIIQFWIDTVGPKGWYMGSDALDAQIRELFLVDWYAAKSGLLEHWCDGSRSALAYLILTDQFSRNLFRNDAYSFALDEAARNCARNAIDKGFDLEVALPERQFFYTPFMHSEAAEDQAHSVALYQDRMSDPRGQGDTLHARVHQEIIRTYGRFPYRNAALGRDTTAAEQVFLDGGGYRKIVQSLQAGT